MLELTRDLENQIRMEAQEFYPDECCGFLLGTEESGTRKVTGIWMAQNQRSDSLGNRYLISPEDFRKVEQIAEESRQTILGLFHSHPDSPARPSTYDIDYAWPWFSYVIVSVREGQATEITSWQLESDRSRFNAEELRILPGVLS